MRPPTENAQLAVYLAYADPVRVTADEVCGQDSKLRAEMARRSSDGYRTGRMHVTF